MAQIAQVVGITGDVIAVGLDGQTRVLKVGDAIESRETLRTLAGARVELLMADGQVLAVAPEQTVLVDNSLVQTDATPTAQEASIATATPAAVMQAIQLEKDLFAAFEAPAAGLTVAGTDSGGSSFVRLLRISEGVDPLSYQYSLNPLATIDTVTLSAEPPGALLVVRYVQLDDNGQPLLQSNGAMVFLDGKDVVEGTRVGLYATVNLPPTATDLVIEFSTGQSITIPAGGGSGLVELLVRPDDPYVQGREVLDVAVTNVTGGEYSQLDIDQSTSIAVVDDNDLTRVGISGPVSVREGDVTTPYTVALERPAQTPVEVTFEYSGVARDGTDFTGVASVTIAAGQSSQTFTIQTLADQLAEGSELYNIRISSITGGNFERFEIDPVASAVDTTIIDATPLTLNLAGDGSVAEGAAASYTVSLAGGTLTNDQQVSVQVATGPGMTLVPDATPGVDYNPLTQTLTFTAAAQAPVRLSVVTLDDALVEGSEEYMVNLSNAVGATIGQGGVTTQIIDDDVPQVSITIAQPSVQEDGTANLVYQLQLDQTPLADTVVTIALGGTATSSTDYDVTGLTGTVTRTVTIPAGQTSVTFEVDPVADLLDEADETVVATIVAATGATVNPAATRAIGTIVDDDNIPLIGNDQARVSDEGLATGMPDALGANPDDDRTNSATYSGSLNLDRNGTAPLTVELLSPGTSLIGGTSLVWSSGGTNVLIGSDLGGEVMRVILNGGSTAVATAGASVSYSVVLSRPVSHLLQGAGTDGEDAASLNLTVRISDGVNPVDEGTLTVTVEDDGPVITAASVLVADSLTVDESNLAANATANFADNFGAAIQYGADGAGTTGYSLVLAGANVNSGLYALGAGGAQGSQILLNQAGNVVTGSVGGVDYFTLTVNNTTGDVTLDQLAAIYHANAGNADDGATLSTVAGALVLRATVTDADGDRATHDLDLGAGALVIKDDGPLANPDADSLLSSPSVIETGNVITGSGTAGGIAGPGVDMAGTDGSATIAGAVAGVGTVVAGVGLGTAVNGSYGKLILGTDGAYSYELYSALESPTSYNELRALDVGESRTDTFTYLLKDADNDTSSSSLTFTVNAVNDLPTVVKSNDNLDPTNPSTSNDLVYESHMPAGTNPSAPVVDLQGRLLDRYATGSITLRDFDGLDDIQVVRFQTTVGGVLQTHNFTDAQIEAIVSGTPATYQSFATQNGVVTLTAYNASTGVISYRFELTGPATDIQGTPDPAESNQFTVTTTDESATYLPSPPVQVTIEIVDDVPKAERDASVPVPTLKLDESTTTVVPSIGGRADGIASASVSFLGNFKPVVYGADGPASSGGVVYELQLTGSNVSSGLFALNAAAPGGKGQEILLTQSGNVIYGQAYGQTYFDIAVVASGADAGKVTFTLNGASIWHGDPSNGDDPALLALPNPSDLRILQKVTDADGDDARAAINLGSGIFSIEDDGPVANAYTSGLPVDPTGYLSLVNGNGWGTDGGHVDSITLEGTTYTWDKNAGSIGVTGSVDRLNGFDASTHLMEVALTGGGVFVIDMDDGRYSLPSKPTADIHLDAGYTLVDNDGDRASSTLPINLEIEQIDLVAGGHVVTGTTGHDVLLGEDGNDTLSGLSGDDLLIGGKDSDTMTGGGGADTFVWHRDDHGTGGAIDTITDFGSGGELDKLDLRDLLQGEHAGTSGSLEQYLHFGSAGGDAVIGVTVNGGNPDGLNPPDMRIVLQGVTLAGADDASKIANLLASGKLVVDY